MSIEHYRGYVLKLGKAKIHFSVKTCNCAYSPESMLVSLKWFLQRLIEILLMFILVVDSNPGKWDKILEKCYLHTSQNWWCAWLKPTETPLLLFIWILLNQAILITRLPPTQMPRKHLQQIRLHKLIKYLYCLLLI